MKLHLQKFILMIALLLSPIALFAHPTEYHMTDLGTLESDFSEATWINEAGRVVGYYKLNGDNHTFFWDQQKGLRTLDLPASAVPKKLNNANQIIGTYSKEAGKPATHFFGHVHFFGHSLL